MQPFLALCTASHLLFTHTRVADLCDAHEHPRRPSPVRAPSARSSATASAYFQYRSVCASRACRKKLRRKLQSVPTVVNTTSQSQSCTAGGRVGVFLHRDV